jgi:sigma-B regulation protein RsbU (phosphoserine phosphatase)
VRADGTLVTLEPPGRLMGMVDDIAAASVRVAIEPGDTIVAYTDGITEARAPDGRFYGEDRFRGLLAGVAGRTAIEIVETVIEDVATFRAGAEPSDDLTLLVVRRQPRD